ncbi:MAG: cation transporter, partial [Flavobacteriaceae bacterium]|nr:cation transporter [Flavobacteriaceae bacterium]
MKHTYSLKGMTCGGCKASVEKHLSQIDGVSAIEVSLENEEVSLSLNKNIAIEVLQNILPQKFSITEIPLQRTSNQKVDLFTVVEEQSKLKQLQPLLIILFYILGATLLLHYKNWDISAMMLDFMGLFFIVFSFFKMLDLKNFPSSFRMYDPLAKKIPFYAWMYPFI